ncbi:hypothetical protein EVAR_102103_1 [Eumeta japonica]|uniref:Uncharacterized protein n=1 Tax=Eumeta variegata TaxID=151549 RepID=A0A4C1TZR1_EUMVA|nr:hypothetical protein EVAR_102103_1 [Eumeta japonica]
MRNLRCASPTSACVESRPSAGVQMCQVPFLCSVTFVTVFEEFHFQLTLRSSKGQLRWMLELKFAITPGRAPQSGVRPRSAADGAGVLARTGIQNAARAGYNCESRTNAR